MLSKDNARAQLLLLSLQQINTATTDVCRLPQAATFLLHTCCHCCCGHRPTLPLLLQPPTQYAAAATNPPALS
jgi:hypothetical protein